MPERIQLKRTKGWRMPENTVKVDRSTRYGNPFPVGAEGPLGRKAPDAEGATGFFRAMLVDAELRSVAGYPSDLTHDESDPLPAVWDDTAPDEVQGFFSGETLRARDRQIVELCASICEQYESAKWDAYKRGNGPERASDYTQGESDGAGGCAAAIRALLGQGRGVMAEIIARKFHEAYERLAPSFGYATRPETREFDPQSPNGRLMIAVCAEVATALASPSVPQWRPIERALLGDKGEK